MKSKNAPCSSHSLRTFISVNVPILTEWGGGNVLLQHCSQLYINNKLNALSRQSILCYFISSYRQHFSAQIEQHTHTHFFVS